MRYVIIGLGFIYPRHKKCIEESGGKIILTCDIDGSKNPDFLDYKEMFKSEKFKEVDTVVICTPNGLHKQMIKDSLATGKRVLCEKPLIVDNDFEGLEGVNSVLQLRYHDFLPEIRKQLMFSKNKIDLLMKVYRDDRWWNSWRGNQEENGNILLSLAIHMFDFLIFILGDDYVVHYSEKSRKKCVGSIEWPTAHVDYNVEVLDSTDGQTRSFIINGINYELCNKDNLSFAGYHDQIYEDFIKGNGIPLSEARKAVELINKL